MLSFDTQVSIATFALLFFVFQVKHFGADFLLQNTWMAHGKACSQDWAAPLAAHAGLHGLGTLSITLGVNPTLWWLGAIDFAVHGLIDRAKALFQQRKHFPESDRRFWWLVGFDQFLHHVTSIAIISLLILL